MSFRHLKFALGALGAAAIAMSSAQAAPLIGGVSFTDGLENFGTSTWIVSQLAIADDNPASIDTASSCTDQLAASPPGPSACLGPATGNFAHDFNIGALGTQLAYDYDGYSFYVTAFGPINRTPLACNGTQCFDFLNFAATGYVTGNGIDPTAITLSWSAQGICNEGPVGECARVTTASWSASISANGAPFLVPEPGSMALLGLGLVAAGIARRRKQ
jgi:hypothetical protein